MKTIIQKNQVWGAITIALATIYFFPLISFFQEWKGYLRQYGGRIPLQSFVFVIIFLIGPLLCRVGIGIAIINRSSQIKKILSVLFSIELATITLFWSKIVSYWNQQDRFFLSKIAILIPALFAIYYLGSIILYHRQKEKLK